LGQRLKIIILDICLTTYSNEKIPEPMQGSFLALLVGFLNHAPIWQASLISGLGILFSLKEAFSNRMTGKDWITATIIL